MSGKRLVALLVLGLLCAPAIPMAAAPNGTAAAPAADFGIYDYIMPCPGERTFTQPDGTTFEGTGRGMEIGGGITLPDGKVAVMDERGWYTYSTSKKGGISQPSSFRVGKDRAPAALSNGGGSDSVWLDAAGTDAREPLFDGFRSESSGLAVVNYLVLMVDFTTTGVDDKFVVGHDAAYFEAMLNGTGGNPTGTVTEFYVENSYGAFTPWFHVKGPFTVAGSHSTYAGTNPAFMTLALDAADPTVNFASYNYQFVIFIHAGPDQSATSNPLHIWSFATTLNYATDDGVTITKGCTGPDVGANIGVYCHEMGHTIGCPDYYDTTYTTEGTGEWEVMAGGSWLGHPAGSNPPHFNPYSKYVTLAWMTPTMISATTKGAALNHYELTATASSIRVQLSTSEWFYFQYVNNTCARFNRYLHNSGLVIWHYDANGAQNTPNRMRLAVEEWDSLDGTQELRLKKNRGEPTDPFHDDPTGMTPITTPNTYLGAGTNSGWSFCNISSRGTVMTFDLLRPLTTYAELSAGLPYTENTPPLLNQTSVALSSYIFNSGNKAASSVKVRFYDGVPGSGGVQIGSDVTIATLSAYTKVKASVTWTAQPHGPHDIYVLVDPDNTIAEASNTNNAEHAVIWVWPRNAPVLLVDDDSNFDWNEAYETALNALGYPYVKVVNTASLTLMNNYEIVIWITGSNRVSGALNTTEISYLKSYLGTGKCAWFASPRLSSALGAPTSSLYPGVDNSFLANYLGARYNNTVMTNVSWANGTGDEIGGTDSFLITDEPLSRAQSDCMAVNATAGGTASMDSSYGLQYATKKDGGTWKTVFFGFDLTQVVGAANQLLLTQRVLDWFRQSTVSLDSDRYGSEDSVIVQVHDPDLGGSVTVNVKSGTEPAGESVVCAQVSPGNFEGTLPISETDAAGVLHVTPGENINATYIDASPSKTRWALAFVTVNVETPFSIDLSGKAAGSWAFVSFPSGLTGNIQDILNDATAGDAGTTWSVAKWYDPADPADPWKTYRAGGTANDMPAINNRMGFWLYITANGGDQALTLGGYAAVPASTVITLREGWNCVGYPSTTPMLGSATLPAQADTVSTWQAAAPYVADQAPAAVTMSAGNGYWVHVTAECEWTVGA